MAISDLGNTLITLGLDMMVILLKIWLFLMILSTTSKDKEVFVFSIMYRIPMILR